MLKFRWTCNLVYLKTEWCTQNIDRAGYISGDSPYRLRIERRNSLIHGDGTVCFGDIMVSSNIGQGWQQLDSKKKQKIEYNFQEIPLSWRGGLDLCNVSLMTTVLNFLVCSGAYSSLFAKFWENWQFLRNSSTLLRSYHVPLEWFSFQTVFIKQWHGAVWRYHDLFWHRPRMITIGLQVKAENWVQFSRDPLVLKRKARP